MKWHSEKIYCHSAVECPVSVFIILSYCILHFQYVDVKAATLIEPSVHKSPLFVCCFQLCDDTFLANVRHREEFSLRTRRIFSTHKGASLG